MRPRRFLITAAALLSVGVFATAAKKPKKDATPLNVSDLIQPVPQLYLRTTFDNDPSIYMGRFVPDGMEPVDETSAFQTSCGQYIQHRIVDASGHFEQFFAASTSSMASLGIPMLANVGAGGDRSTIVRATYDLTRKMVADIPNDQIAAYEACCKRAADQCAERYVGEFIEGKGAIFQAIGTDIQAGGDAVTKTGIGIDLEVSRGVQWQRAVTFETPVYFALKTTQNRFQGERFEPCGSWVDSKPTSSQGRYYIGIGTANSDEGIARDTGFADALQQLAMEHGVRTAGGSLSRTAGVQGMSMDVADTLARLATVESTCDAPYETPNGVMHKLKVLVFVPEGAWESAQGE